MVQCVKRYGSQVLFAVACALVSLFGADFFLSFFSFKTIFGRALPLWIPIFLIFFVAFWLFLKKVSFSQLFETVKKFFRRSDLLVILLVLACFTLSVWFITQIATYFRYLNDDYLNISNLRAMGWIGYAKNLYFGWSGRYAFVVLVGIAERIDQRFVSLFFIWVSLIAMSVGLYFFSGSLLNPSQKKDAQTRLKVFVASVSLSILIILAAENAFTTWYWMMGTITYGIGIAFAVLGAGLLSRILFTVQRTHFFPGSLIFISFFIAMGCNELIAIVSFLLTGSALIYALLRQKPIGKPKLFFGLFLWLFVCCCLAFSFLSPGNMNRVSATAGATVSLFENVQSVARLWIALFDRIQSIYCLFAFPLGFLVASAFTIRKNERIRALVLALLLFLISFASLVLNAYSTWMPLRAYGVPNTFITIALFLFGVCLSPQKSAEREPNSPFYSCLIALICLVLLTANFYRSHIGHLQEFKQELDFRHEQMMNLTDRSRIVKTCDVDLFFGEIVEISRTEPNYWTNLAFAAYYELEKVVSVGRCTQVSTGKISLVD